MKKHLKYINIQKNVKIKCSNNRCDYQYCIYQYLGSCIHT